MKFRTGDVSKEQVEIAKKHIKHNSTKVLGVDVIEVDKVLEIMDNMHSYSYVTHISTDTTPSNEMAKFTQKVEMEKADKKYNDLVYGIIISVAKEGKRSCCIDSKEMIPFLDKKLKDNGYKLKHHKSESDGIYPASDFWEIEW
jgi:hypothetical protein